MIVALVSVGLCLLTESSLTAHHLADRSADLWIPLSTEDVCYLLEKQESICRWVAGLAPSLHPECYLGQTTWLRNTQGRD